MPIFGLSAARTHVTGDQANISGATPTRDTGYSTYIVTNTIGTPMERHPSTFVPALAQIRRKASLFEKRDIERMVNSQVPQKTRHRSQTT